MPAPVNLAKLSVQEFAERFRQDMIPLSNTLAYFAAMPLSEEELKDYLEEPAAALPPRLQSMFTRVLIALVPYLEKPHGKGGELVTFDRPDPRAQTTSAQFLTDYHYIFYRAVATLVADRMDSEAMLQFSGMLRDELRSNVHGEVDEGGWNLKQALLRRQAEVRRETKAFRSYARQAFIDTFTLYLHGICCDIDVETGPRQLPSRHLRKRLQFLHEMFPPPAGYAVFPEELNG